MPLFGSDCACVIAPSSVEIRMSVRHRAGTGLWKISRIFRSPLSVKFAPAEPGASAGITARNFRCPGNIFLPISGVAGWAANSRPRTKSAPVDFVRPLLLSSRKKESPIRGRKGGFVSRQSEAPAERMAAYRQIPINLRRACRRRKSRHRKSPQSGVFRCPPRRGGVLNSEGKKDKTEAIHRIRVAKHASAASADTRRSLGPEGRAGFAPRTWARSGHCRYLPKKRGE